MGKGIFQPDVSICPVELLRELGVTPDREEEREGLDVNVTTLLDELAQQDIRLSVDADSLAIDAPRGLLTEDLKSKIRALKPKILARLRARELRLRDRIEDLPKETTDSAKVGTLTAAEVRSLRGQLEQVKDLLRQTLESVSLQMDNGWSEKDIRELNALNTRIRREDNSERFLNGRIIFNRAAMNALQDLADLCDLLDCPGYAAAHHVACLQRCLDWYKWQEGDR